MEEGETRCIVGALAYMKVLLHASKHFSVAVNGVLLGSEDGGEVRVKDAVALMHGQLSLSPLLEAGLCQVEERCKQTGMRIIGYYHANELLEDGKPPVVAARVSDRIRESVLNACMLMVDNKALEPNRLSSECALRLWLRPKGRNAWSHRGILQVEGGKESIAKVAQTVIDPKIVSRLFDFDDHCDKVVRDYFNDELTL